MAHSSTPSTTSPSQDDLYLSDIITGAHGDKYQKDLALLMFERATRKRYDFLLGYEMAIADKFDDVAYFDRVSNNWTLIQTKHADTSKGKSPLKFDMLFPKDEGTREKGDFSLFKYFKSYVTVQDNIKERKNVIIFTNRDLPMNSLEQSVQVEPRKVDDILVFDRVTANKVEPRHVGLKVNDCLIKEMVDYVNRDFFLLRDGIVKLFKEGTMDQAIKNFKTPVTSILTKVNNTVTFSQDPPSEVCQMFEELSKFINTKTAEMSLNKCKDLFTGKSRSKTWPLCTNENTAHQFFQDLILSVAQPDDLSDIIDQDIRLWMRTWIRPQYYTRLEESQLEMVSRLEQFFNNRQSVETNDDAKSSYKKFLKVHDGEEFFGTKKNNLEKQIRNLSNYNENPASDYYINRRIEYVVVSEDQTRCDIDEEKIVKMRIFDENFVTELKGKFNNQQILLLTAEPGMGKSTILEHIAMVAQKISSDFVYLFHLNTFNQKLKNVPESGTIEDFLSILETVLSQTNFHTLCENVTCNREKINFLLIFDAFDEILPQNRTKVLKLFEHLSKVSNVKIIVSARRTVKTSIENELKVVSMSLVPFNEHDQINFLRKFWKVSKENESRFFEYVTYLLEVLHSEKNRALYEFTGLPLILKMIAEVYDDHLREYLTSQRTLKELVFKDMFNIVGLYEQFVRKGFNNKMLKKYNNFQDDDEENDVLFNNFTLEHQLFAIKHLQIDQLQAVLQKEKHEKTLKPFERRLMNSTEKSPLVEAVNNDSRFTHRSYAEFLVAKFVFCNIQTYETIVKQLDDIDLAWLEEPLNENSPVELFGQYPMIRIFFFTMVAEQCKTKHFPILEMHYKKNSGVAMWACEVRDLRTVQYLLRNIYDSTIIDRLFHVAAEHNYQSMCTYLLRNHQVDVDFQTNGRVSLHNAAAKGHVEVVRMLINKSADNKATDNYFHKNPLHFAAEGGHLEVVKMLIDNSADIEANACYGDKPLHYAAKCGHLDVVKMLIDESADIEAKDKYGCTPLHGAAGSGHLEVVKLLINKSADIEVKTNDGKTPLHYASSNGHLKVVEMLIDNSVDIDAKDRDDKTPLHYAAALGYLEVAIVLINHSADIEAKDTSDSKPLHYAAGSGLLEVVKMLVDKSTDIEAKDDYNLTPLHYAAQSGHLEVVKMLIDKSADIEAKDHSAETPLHYAAVRGHLEVSKMLIDRSADIEAQNKFSKTPLHYAAECGRLEVAEMLINKSADINAKNDGAETPLHCAIGNGHLEVIKLLIDKSADIEAKDEYDQTPLQRAVDSNQLEVVKMLIDGSANIKVKDEYGQTPLHYATEKHYLEVVKMLIDKSADIDAKTNDGKTPLHYAAECGNIKVVEMLIDKSADIDSKDNGAETPLHHAIKNGRVEVVKMLIDKSADIEARNELGQTPLQRAFDSNQLEVVKLLIDRLANNEAEDEFVQTPLQRAFESKEWEVVKMLIDKSAEIDAKDDGAETSLHHAIENGSMEVIQMLIDNSADIEAKNKFSETPLHLAAGMGHFEVVKMLINKSANIEAKDDSVETPLHHAAARGNLEIIEMLIDYSANIEAKNKFSETPLHYAAGMGHLEVVKMLIDNAADIEAKDDCTKTPLHHAAARGHLKVVEMLIGYSADFESRNKFCETPLHCAAGMGHLEVVKMLIDILADIEAKDDRNETPLHHAVVRGHLEVAQMLTDNLANIEAKNNFNETPLHCAAGKGHLEVVKMLVDRLADIEAKDDRIETPLHQAAVRGHLKVVEMLIDNSADIVAKNILSETPLHHAAGMGHLEVVKMLIDKSADIEAKDDRMETPLHHAAARGHLEVAQMLINNSADFEARNKFGEMPFRYAAGLSQMGLIKFPKKET